MMTLTTNRKVEVMSNAKGDAKKYAQENKIIKPRDTRKASRETAKTERKDLKQQFKTGTITKEKFKSEKKKRRKAKLNAIKLQFLKRFTKDGKPLFVYRLKEVVQDLKDKKYKKKHPDGSDSEVKKDDIVSTPQGLYDINEIAKAMNVSVESLKNAQAQLIDILIPLASSSKGQAEAVDVPKSDNSADMGVIVPESNVTQTDDGGYYTNNETFDASSFDPNEKVPDVKDDEKKPPLKNWEKGLLWGGIAVAAIVVGVIVYRKIKSNGSKG